MKIALLRMFAIEIPGVFGLTAFLYWAAWVWPVLPYGFGSGIFEAAAFLLPLASLGAVPVILVAVVSVIKNSERALAARILGLSIAVVAGTAVGIRLGPTHRMQRIRHAAASAMPFVRAIEAFERDEGRPPQDLSELLPRYVAVIPSTGMAGYAEWDYIRGSDAYAYEENSWVLLVHTGGPGINFDQLMYFPNQKYPESGYGGRIERIGSWAYVHE